jgi:hypothetical protein
MHELVSGRDENMVDLHRLSSQPLIDLGGI